MKTTVKNSKDHISETLSDSLYVYMHTDHTLHSGSIMTVDAYDRRDTYFVREDEEKKRKAVMEKITRQEYTLDWSQSKVGLFLVFTCFLLFYGQIL